MPRECPECGGETSDHFRFCPWCAAAQRRKLVEFFCPHARFVDERRRALRVSRYLDEGHVRFSVWEDDEAQAAISLSEGEARRLVTFLVAGRNQRPSMLGELRHGVDRLTRSLTGR